MRFGFFDQLPCAPGYSEPQRYKDIIAQIELGDAVGFHTAWLGEIHFIREFSILADPLMVIAAGGDLAAIAQPDKDRRGSGDRRHPQRRSP
jgi:hypothetical protein